MSTTPSSTDARHAADREKRRVAISSLAAAFFLVSMKAVVGVLTGSLGILAEAAHSALDLVAAAVTFWAVRISARPADRDHTYGHGKFENLSALIQTVLLLVTCVWIFYEAGSRLFFREEVHVDANVWAFLVIVVSIVVDFSRSRALSRVAKKHGSQALEADALHFSTDIWSSTVVLFGLAGVVVAERLAAPWLVKADAVAAVGVAGIVIWVSFKLGKKSVDDLLDRVPAGLQEEVTAAAGAVPGVEQVSQVRLRRSGPEMFADVTLSVDRSAAFEGAHRVADRVEGAVRRAIGEADVVVHVEPVASDDEEMTTTVRVLAARRGLNAHEIRIYDDDGRRSLELDLEMDGSLDLEEAHRRATAFEQEIRRALPELIRIVTHLEPAGDAASVLPSRPGGTAEIEAAIAEFLQAEPLAADAYDVNVQRAGDELAVSFRCTLDPATNITDAHDFTERLKNHVRRRVPGVGRVVIHVEPAGIGQRGEG